jgi:hypothetical protein
MNDKLENADVDKRTELRAEGFRHEDNALGNRTDFFLIFHAILLEAYFSGDKPPWVAIAISLFGFTCAFLWLSIGFRQRVNHQFAIEVLKQDWLVSRDFACIQKGIGNIREKQSTFFKWAIATSAFAVVIPLAATILWAIIVIQDKQVKAHSIQLSSGYILLTVVVIVAVILMWLLMTWKPKFNFDPIRTELNALEKSSSRISEEAIVESGFGSSKEQKNRAPTKTNEPGTEGKSSTRRR